MEKKELTVWEEMELRAKIAKKIIDMSKAIGKLKNDGTNKQQGYPFISAEQMKAEVREKSPDFGLCIIPNVIERSEEKSEKTIRTSVMMSFNIIDTDTGYQIVAHFTGSDQDYGGKSEQQAITQCNKYFLFNLFKVSTKDEQDGDSKTTEMTYNKGNTQQKTVQTAPAKVKLTVESLSKVIEKINGGDFEIWEKNKAKYEYTAEQETQITDAIKKLGKY